MLTIRLSRVGKKNKPMFRLIISEKARDPYGRALEILGSYNPFTKELVAKADRINHWISQGAGTSATVNNLLIENEIIKGEKQKATKINKKKSKNKEQEAKNKEQVGNETTKDKAEGLKEEITSTSSLQSDSGQAPQVEEVKEEKPAEESKTEEKPAEEPKKEEVKTEEPKTEEKPTEEPKKEEEAKPEEKAV